MSTVLNSTIEPFCIEKQEYKIRNTKFLSLFHLIYIRLEINERFYIPWNLPLTILRGFKFHVLLGINTIYSVVSQNHKTIVPVNYSVIYTYQGQYFAWLITSILFVIILFFEPVNKSLKKTCRTACISPETQQTTSMAFHERFLWI